MSNRLKHTSSADVGFEAGCPSCGHDGTVDVFRLGRLPVNVGVFYDTRQAAVEAPRGQITLAYCPRCDFVHNRHFDASQDIFKPGYEVALHHSQTFRSFITGVAEGLVDRFDLNDKRIVEIGCGDAFFLKTLAEIGHNHGTGIDPTVARPGPLSVKAGRVELVRDYFGPAHQERDADFICALSVLEDIPRPEPFLAAVHAMASRTGAPLYFEVFNAWRAFEQREVWSVHYEQCNYFSLASLRTLFERNGFVVARADTCYQGDQYLFVEATPIAKPAAPADDAPSSGVPAVLTAFRKAFEERHDLWSRYLEGCRVQGQRVVVWGTGGKGITFLNALPTQGVIDYVVEINPDKQGKYVPGTGQPIVPPSFLADYQPHKIIITNALYRAEMEAQARELGVDAEFLVA